MTRINNLFFIYVLVCLGLGVGRAYWDEEYSQYLFMVISTIVVALLVFSKKFYSKESHLYFFKQAFMTTLITILCGLITNDSRMFKAMDIAFYYAWIGSITFWFFTLFYQRNNNRNTRNDNLNQNNGGPTLAWWLLLSGFLLQKKQVIWINCIYLSITFIKNELNTTW